MGREQGGTEMSTFSFRLAVMAAFAAGGFILVPFPAMALFLSLMAIIVALDGVAKGRK